MNMNQVLRRSFISFVRSGLTNRNRIISSPCAQILRLKHSSHFRQHRGKKLQEIPITKNETEEQPDLDLNDYEYDSIANSTMHVSDKIVAQGIFIVQPYVKWGPKKLNVKPEHQINEAEALVRSIPSWSVIKSMKLGLESLDKKTVFGSGQIQQIKSDLQQLRNLGNKISAVFVSKGTLSRVQKVMLESEFGLPVLDRYSVVIQILRLHATSAEAKLQVAMAEIPYIWTQMRDLENKGLAKGQMFFTDVQKELLKSRERRLKEELDRIRSQRVLLRRKRTKMNFPIVAVVGYTNAGKTSLIKALTNEKSLQPRDQLFATLDVTSHAGVLPCKLDILYMDTVGFMSDIPTGLIECFVATLEDAMLADVIIHVQDISHENYDSQKKHVETTLDQLLQNIESQEPGVQLPPIINVGNKVDIYEGDVSQFENMEIISSKTLIGINDLLKTLENRVLEATNRKKMIIKVRSGSEEVAWLYKNSAVTDTEGDPNSSDHLLVHVVISIPTLQQFKHKFINGPRKL